MSIVLYDEKKNLYSSAFDSRLQPDKIIPATDEHFQNNLFWHISRKVHSSLKPLLLQKSELNDIARQLDLSGESEIPSSCLAIPLLEKDTFIGILFSHSNSREWFHTEGELEIFHSLAIHVSESVDQKQKEQTLLKNEEITRAIFAISNAVNTTENLDELYVSIHKF